jgi:hypothetical protein
MQNLFGWNLRQQRDQSFNAHGLAEAIASVVWKFFKTYVMNANDVALLIENRRSRASTRRITTMGKITIEIYS